MFDGQGLSEGSENLRKPLLPSEMAESIKSPCPLDEIRGRFIYSFEHNYMRMEAVSVLSELFRRKAPEFFAGGRHVKTPRKLRADLRRKPRRNRSVQRLFRRRPAEDDVSVGHRQIIRDVALFTIFNREESYHV